MCKMPMHSRDEWTTPGTRTAPLDRTSASLKYDSPPSPVHPQKAGSRGSSAVEWYRGSIERHNAGCGFGRGRCMEFQDKTLTCRECGKPFMWTAGEQQFFREKQLINIPARCNPCRSARKAKLGLPDRAQTEVTCAECGHSTTVPFVPRNGNPVYCSGCLVRVRAAVSADQTAVARSG